MPDLTLYWPFDAGAGADVLEDGWRAMARNWLTSGPIRLELNSFVVASDSGRNVLLRSGRVWINGHYGELSTDTVVAVAANATGNPRIDRIILRADFTNNKLEYAVLQGTPAGTPAAPALTQNTAIWEISLAQLALAAGYTTIPAGNITDERRFAAGRPPGGPFLIACAAPLATPKTITIATWTDLDFDGTEEYDTAGIHSPTVNSKAFTIPGGCDGLWTFTCLASWGTTFFIRHGLRFLRNGNGSLQTTFAYNSAPEASGDTDVQTDVGSVELACVAGDVITWQVRWNSGFAHGPEAVVAGRATARYLGSLVA